MGQWTKYHPVVFFLTFLSYALFHVNRKTISYVKTSITREWTPPDKPLTCASDSTLWKRTSLFPDLDSAEKFLGVLNATFLFTYAVGLYISGAVAERLDLRLFLVAGMVLSAVVLFVFGPVLEWTDMYNEPAYVSLMVLNGLMQSTGWPCVIAVMGNWFGKRSRGMVLGLWSASPSVGSILGAVVVSTVVRYGYEYGFLLSSSIMIAGAVLIFTGLVASPKDVGLPAANDKTTVRDRSRERSHGQEKPCDQMPLLEESREQTSNYGTMNHEQSSALKETCEDTAVVAGISFCCETVNKITGCVSRLPTTSKAVGSEHSNTEHQDQTVLLVPKRDENNIETNQEEIQDHNSSQCVHVKCTVGLKNGSTICFQSDKVADCVGSSNHPAKPKGGVKCIQKHTNNHRQKPISFIKALLLPGVIPYALAMGCVKMVNYVFFFWLPFFLSSAHGWPEWLSDQLSVWFDIGGIVGSTVAGFLCGCLDRRALVITPMLITAIPVLYVYGELPSGQPEELHATELFILGFLLAGTANIISTAISADIGCQDAVRGNVKALATVAGIIEGTGTLGAALGQLAVPYLNTTFGWNSVFYLLMAATALTIVNILPMVRGELKETACYQGFSARRLTTRN